MLFQKTAAEEGLVGAAGVAREITRPFELHDMDLSIGE